ncbi:SpoIIE family protein phosphatase [Actinomadura sp. PM05-2]|uniref:SpoIIE family protein phosphatase n=2 Tax=Actinomadura parmotrematis TaxID=2864039 RepID=A0ABS7G2Y9_9ACTN|nr:SpoIIE family protein phosphatase [Actinomadura parmotrematis]
MTAGLEGLTGAGRERALLAEAREVLADRLGCPTGEALQHLIWLARDLDLDMTDAAEMVVGDRETVPETGVQAFLPPLPPHAAPAAPPPAQADRDEVLRRAARFAAEDDRALLAALPHDAQAHALLDASMDSAAHLVPVRGPDGRVVDLLYARLNDAAEDLFGQGAAELTGRRLLCTEPGSALTGLFDAYVTVLESGAPYARGPFAYAAAKDGVSRSTRLSVRAVAVPTGVVVIWRHHHEEDRTRRRLERVERLGRLGFGEWDLVSGEANWSAQMSANYGLDPEDAPASPHDLAKVVAEQDIAMVEEAVADLFERREPVEIEHRVPTPDGRHRHLWMFAEPVLDDAGRPVSINIVSQDITRRRGIERALAETRRQMLRQQARTAQEHRVAVTLRRAILPDPADVQQLPGLVVAVRSQAAESAARIGGDWFATRELPGGRGLFAIGDAAGHGLPAAAAMARTRNGLLGLASTGEHPGRLVGWLNELVDDMEPAATGTAIVADYDRATRMLRWTSAGHPPPILVRGGAAVVLEGEPDPILGALPGVEYTGHEIRLYEDDVVYLYTDGLVERRDADIGDRIARLAEILRTSANGRNLALDKVLARMEHDRAADDTTLVAVRVR